MTDAIRRHVEQGAAAVGLEPRLLLALVEVESSGHPWAWNPEPAYPYLWDVHNHRPFRDRAWAETIAKIPPADFYDVRGFRGRDADAEWWGQQSSWGLMQVMGAVAREFGFRGLYLSALCDPATNVTVGGAVLAGHVKWSDGDVAKALGAYNAGRGGWQSAKGQAYSRKVLARMI
jgi:hypothetical protein